MKDGGAVDVADRWLRCSASAACRPRTRQAARPACKRLQAQPWPARQLQQPQHAPPCQEDRGGCVCVRGGWVGEGMRGRERCATSRSWRLRFLPFASTEPLSAALLLLIFFTAHSRFGPAGELPHATCPDPCRMFLTGPRRATPTSDRNPLPKLNSFFPPLFLSLATSWSSGMADAEVLLLLLCVCVLCVLAAYFLCSIVGHACCARGCGRG